MLENISFSIIIVVGVLAVFSSLFVEKNTSKKR